MPATPERPFDISLTPLDPSINPVAGCTLTGPKGNGGYFSFGEVDTAKLGVISQWGDQWKITVPNRYQAVAVVVYYGKKSVTDLNGQPWTDTGQAQDAGVVDICMAQ